MEISTNLAGLTAVSMFHSVVKSSVCQFCWHLVLEYGLEGHTLERSCSLEVFVEGRKLKRNGFGREISTEASYQHPQCAGRSPKTSTECSEPQLHMQASNRT